MAIPDKMINNRIPLIHHRFLPLQLKAEKDVFFPEEKLRAAWHFSSLYGICNGNSSSTWKRWLFYVVVVYSALTWNLIAHCLYVVGLKKALFSGVLQIVCNSIFNFPLCYLTIFCCSKKKGRGGDNLWVKRNRMAFVLEQWKQMTKQCSCRVIALGNTINHPCCFYVLIISAVIIEFTKLNGEKVS